MGHPGTGTRWDAYQAAITGADVIKGPSLQHALLDLEGIIAVLETSDPDSAVDPPTAPRAARERRVFVSHGKDSPALTKVERFLRDLGVTPVIVKYGPSRGGAVDDVVEREMASCECAVILATKDDAVDGRWQPRPNVLHEIGLAQEKLKDRLIYLKEADCTYPSNIAPKIWETFTQDNLENAFSKIAKELRAFGVIS
jgi:predicted nucleotide-binding protein